MLLAAQIPEANAARLQLQREGLHHTRNLHTPTVSMTTLRGMPSRGVQAGGVQLPAVLHHGMKVLLQNQYEKLLSEKPEKTTLTDHA